MRVLGVDPGTRCTGYGVVAGWGDDLRAEAFGAIRMTSKQHVAARLNVIFDRLNEVIAAHRPEVMALEKAFYGKNVQSAMRIGEARAVAMLSAQRADLPIAEYAPAMVKRAVVGGGRAHKTQIQRMVRIILGLREDPEPEDAADALALAVCHLHRAALAERLE